MVPEPLRGPTVQITPHARGLGAGAQNIDDQPMQDVPASAQADRLHEQVRRGEIGEALRTIARAGEDIGKVRADEVDHADLLEEAHELRGLPVQHLAEQVASNAVVIAGKILDRGLDIIAPEQVQRGQAQAGRPTVRPSDEPLHLPRRQVQPQLGVQRGRLVKPDREIGRPHVGQHPRQP